MLLWGWSLHDLFFQMSTASLPDSLRGHLGRALPLWDQKGHGTAAGTKLLLRVNASHAFNLVKQCFQKLFSSSSNSHVQLHPGSTLAGSTAQLTKPGLYFPQKLDAWAASLWPPLIIYISFLSERGSRCLCVLGIKLSCFATTAQVQSQLQCLGGRTAVGAV